MVHILRPALVNQGAPGKDGIVKGNIPAGKGQAGRYPLFQGQKRKYEPALKGLGEIFHPEMGRRQDNGMGLQVLHCRLCSIRPQQRFNVMGHHLQQILPRLIGRGSGLGDKGLNIVGQPQVPVLPDYPADLWQALAGKIQ